MRPRVSRVTQHAEFYTPERCHILEVGNLAEDTEASVARARVEPGVTTRWHRLRATTERYYILSGQGEVAVGDLPPQPVGPGDYVLIPADTRQRIRNVAETDLIFLAICSPRFNADAYEDVDADGDLDLP